ncbi:helix-turn-helix domain-containing protein [uncultured Tateyamaria sp.]|uniref:helix-turn-helix domain-containing protein n=1 Tax=uncultured Tateyamaria sp. TaxID=455651 RepID=UPI002610B816|nr:AraC family transcriptional regulator [uncultured Tateyamaria sp.]
MLDVNLESLNALNSDSLLKSIEIGKHGHRSAGPKGQYRFARALQYIADNLEAGVSTKDLASLENLSVYHFSRLFKRSMGVTPYAYVINVRIARARKLLLETVLPISDIAYAVGFSSQSHMTTTMKNLAGHTPGQFRRNSALQSVRDM